MATMHGDDLEILQMTSPVNHIWIELKLGRRHQECHGVLELFRSNIHRDFFFQFWELGPRSFQIGKIRVGNP